MQELFQNLKNKVSILLKKKNEIGWIYQYYGNFNFFASKYEAADKYYKKSIDIAEKTKDYQLRNATQIRLTFIELDADVIKAEYSFRKLLHEAKEKGFIENDKLLSVVYLNKSKKS